MKSLFLTFCLTTVLHTSFAQMMPVTTTIQTPYGNVPHTYYTGSPLHFYGPANVRLKDDFTIVMKNDSTFSSKTKIEHTAVRHSVTVRDAADKKQKIYPGHTKALIRVDEFGNRLYGIPTDTCWLFQAAYGRINSFSFLPQLGTDQVIAIQSGQKGPIVPLTKENLLAMVGDDPKILKLIKKSRLLKAIQLFNKEDDP